MLSLFTVIISGIEGGDTFADAASSLSPAVGESRRGGARRLSRIDDRSAARSPALAVKG
jgi:hypothetical protein